MARGRPCTICDHPRRGEMDKRLAKGETAQNLAKEFGVPQATLYRHRKVCAGLKSSDRADQIERSRGTIALATLPSREELGGSYRQLGSRISEIIDKAEKSGSLAIAISGMNSLRQTFDSMSRLGGLDTPQAQVNVNVAIDATAIANSIAQALVTFGGNNHSTKQIEAIVCEPAEPQ